MSSLQNIKSASVVPAAVLDHPVVAEYHEKKREREKHKEHASSLALPLGAAGLVGGGLGLRHLAGKVVSDNDRRILEDVVNMAARQKAMQEAGTMPPDSGLFYDYLDRASMASKARVFGKPVSELIMDIRKNFGDMLGFPVGDAATDETARSSTEHYHNFGKGPLPAMWHQISKLGEVPSPNADSNTSWLFDKDGRQAKEVEAQFEELKRKVAVDPTITRQWDADSARLNTLRESLPMGPARLGHHAMQMLGDPASEGFEDRLKAYAWGKNHMDRELDPSKGTVGKFVKDYQDKFREYFHTQGGDSVKDIDPADADAVGKALSHGQQMDIVRGFQGWLQGKDPEHAKTFDDVLKKLSPTQADPVEHYSKFGEPVLHWLQDVPNAIGAGAIGLGGALGAYWLGKKLTTPEPVRKPRKLAPVEKSAMKVLHAF